MTTKYTVNLPYVDEHEQGEDFVKEIVALSNHTNDDGRPVFVTNDLRKARNIAKQAYSICLRYNIVNEINIRITQSEVQTDV